MPEVTQRWARLGAYLGRRVRHSGPLAHNASGDLGRRERAGYNVHVAARGQDALDLARRTPIDALLTDIVMPGMSGPRLADAVRLLYPDVGVLLMTGCAEDEAIQRDAGRFDVLRKPVLADRLIESVREALI